MSDQVPLTLKGKARIEQELRKLKTEDRKKIIEAIAVARDHGDLKENAEYHSAREKQSFIEGRIQNLEDKIARAELIDPSKIKSDKIMFGATLVLENEEGEEVSYQIVGEPEADLKEGRIAITSPLARCLLGKKEGDEAVLKTKTTETCYEVVSVEYK